MITDGRGHIDLSGSVGMFVKTLPVLAEINDSTKSEHNTCEKQIVTCLFKHIITQLPLFVRITLHRNNRRTP